ncbi:MAG: hypothetical protein ACJAWR_000068 [Flavobacteriales bacterium]
MNNFLQILFLNPTDKNNIPVALLYLLIFVGVVFVIIKLANDNYLRQILSRVGLDRKKFDNQTSNYSFSKSNLFLQISSIILVTLGLSILTNEYLGSFNLAQNFIGAFLFYIIQVLSFTLFSSLIINTESSFLKHRLSYYELLSVCLFPLILFSLYSPINLSVLVLLVMLSSVFLIMIRISIYLTSLISVFHIILYICTLEITPILFLLKFTFN